jgi:hypothetical protein
MLDRKRVTLTSVTEPETRGGLMTETEPRAAAREAPEGFVNAWLQGSFVPADQEVTA